MLRLDPYIVAGELSGRQPYGLRGWVRLRGTDRLLILQLTGDCGPRLQGKRFRFDVPPADSHPPDFDEQAFARGASFAWQQVGPIVAVVAEIVRAGERAPATASHTDAAPQMQGLHLQWHGQNGPVSIDLPDVPIELVPLDESGNLKEAASAEASADDLPADVWWEDDDEDWLDDVDALEISDADFDDFDDEDPYDLLPAELKDQFEVEAFETDMALPEPDDADNFWLPEAYDELDGEWCDDDEDWVPRSEREPEGIDEWEDTGPAVPLNGLFEPPLLLPTPDEADADEAEQALRTLLAALARYAVAVQFCEHLGPPEAYRLLVEKVCPSEHVYPELRGTQWVHTVYLSEYCEQCGCRLRIDPTDADLFGHYPLGDDDIPF